MCFVGQDGLKMRFQESIFAQQIIQITVQKAVLPDQLKQSMHEKPGVFYIAHAIAGIQQLIQRAFKAIKQCVDQFVFGGVVVIKVAWTDVQLR
jgi:hypothetical protein